jgi:hypothetical protein
MAENFEKLSQSNSGQEEQPVNLETPKEERETEQDKFLINAQTRIRESIGEISGYESDKESNYFYFSPIEYFKKGFVDREMIDMLSSGATVLNVGAGNGNLERVLQEGYKIPENQIGVTDIKLHPKLEKLPFQKYEFDMTEQWPVFAKKFDYILFPESFGVAFGEGQKGNEGVTHRFYTEVEDIIESVKKGEEVRKDDVDFFVSLIEMDSPNTAKKLSTIRQALLNLNDGGEIRMSGDLLSDQEETYLKLKLKHDYPEIEIARNNKGILFFKKPLSGKEENPELEKERRISDLELDLLMRDPYKAINFSDGDSMVYSAIERVKNWHDEIKPDYIFLTETSAVPAGYLFKEAWKTAYPGEPLPKFFRVDPKAMGNKSNAEELAGYQEKLGEYLKKRVQKENARIVIFDEEPVSKNSQTTVKNQIVKKLNIPANNVEISIGSMPPFTRGDWASSDYPGLRITSKKTPPSHKHHEYKSVEDIKFTGEQLRGSSKKDIKGNYTEWVRTKDLIYDLKLAGKKAGTMIALNMDFNRWANGFQLE